jgi:hypothetical protein
MGRWLAFFIEVAALRAAPQDAPASRSMYYTSIFLYWLLGTIILLFDRTYGQAVIVSIIQTGLMLFLSHLGLWIRKLPERQLQTITALTGSGSIILLVAIPVIGWAAQTPEGSNLTQIILMIWIALLIWETVVVGHVYRHALDIPFVAGLGLALVLMYLSFAVTFRIVKIMAMSPG